jgi:hypothetical protein
VIRADRRNQRADQLIEEDGTITIASNGSAKADETKRHRRDHR